MNRPALVVSLLVFAACGDSVDPVGPSSGPTYTLTVNVSTSGYVQGDAFSLSVDSRTWSVRPNQQLSIRDLAEGKHTITVEVREDCIATAPEQSITLTADTSVQFEITCFGWGTLNVVTESFGAAPWRVHSLDLIVGEWVVPLPANGTTTLNAVARQYSPTFYPAPNCTSQSTFGLIDVPADASLELRLQAQCDPAGTLRAFFTATGLDVPRSVLWDAVHLGTGEVRRLRLEPPDFAWYFPGEWSNNDFMLGPGDWTGQLVDLPANCNSPSQNPVSFSITESQVTGLSVSIDCIRNAGWLRVALSTNVNVQTAFFGLNVNGTCTTVIDLLGDFCAQLHPNNSVLIEFAPGIYDVHVTPFGIPSSAGLCTVSPQSPVVVEIRLGATTDAAFSVVCS